MDVKNYIRQCKVVVAARMHCGINAVSEGVPTLFLSYSEKSIGMAKFIYNSDEWYLSLKDVQDHLVDKVFSLMDNEQKLRAYLAMKIPDIVNMYSNDDVKHLIKNKMTYE